MAESSIDAYLIPSDDDHASEYVNDHFKCREWISGFTGSAGTVLVTSDEAFLWTDGRYFLQAGKQLEGSGIELMKMGEPGVPTIIRKIRELAEKAEGSASDPDEVTYTLGFSGDTMTAAEGGKLAEECPVNIVLDKDLVGEIWEDRPPLLPSEIWELPMSSCGKTFCKKLSDVRAAMAEKEADVLLVSDLMETAWLFNLRASDIQNTPVFYAYTVITQADCILFTLPGAVPDSLRAKLLGSGVTLKDYDTVTKVLKDLTAGGKKLWVDREKASMNTALFDNILDAPTPIEMMKAVKNDTEIAATKNAHLKDGVAVTKFIYWLKNTIGKEPLTELKCCDKLEQLRRSQDGCFDLSFPTIAGYMSNGAIIHYEPTPETDAELSPEGFLLVDSGGQYLDGTTDITRTIALGPLSDKMKEYYTLVLKAHIDLAKAKFPRGTIGKTLDEITREPLLERGLDYNHGTGHGVGHVLSVHEGPNYISKRDGTAEYLPGMITSDEPGIYIEGEFGIRIENETLCVENTAARPAAYPYADQSSSPAADLDAGQASRTAKLADPLEELGFETITLVAYERDAIKPELLTEEELEWLNKYHKRVFEALKPRLTADEAAWLEKVTRPLRK